jgi:hypothetical protein
MGQNTIQDGKDLQIYAMEAQCPHLGADLSHAEIEEYEDELVAVCPWHRLVLLSLYSQSNTIILMICRYDFNLKTGNSDTGLKACVYGVQIRRNSDVDKDVTLWLEMPSDDENWIAVEIRPVSEGAYTCG